MRFTAFRLTVDPTPAQIMALGRHMGASRFGFNQCLALVKQALDAHESDDSVRVPWSGFDLINVFNAWKRSTAAGQVIAVDACGVAEVQASGLTWRHEVLQQVFEEAAVDCARALAAFSASRPSTTSRPTLAKGSRERGGLQVGFPRFKRRPRTPGVVSGSFRIRQKTSRNGVGWIRVGDVAPRSVTLPKIGILRVREDTRRLRRLLSNGRGRIVSATVSSKAGRWTISLIVEAADLHPDRQHPVRPIDCPGRWVGVDRGLIVCAVAADRHGNELLREVSPQAWRAGLSRLRRLSSQVSRRKPASQNRGKAAARLTRQHARIRNVRQEFLHQVANRLVKTHDQLALEDLNISGMVRNHRLAAAINDAAWAELARIIGYKQAWRGGRVMAVDRWFPSSKTCSACRTRIATLPLSVRTFTCPSCGHSLDRDLNAATNLAVWAEAHAQIRDPEVRGPVINAYRAARRTHATCGAG